MKNDQVMPNLMFMRPSRIWPIFCQLMAILARFLTLIYFDIQTNFEVNQSIRPTLSILSPLILQKITKMADDTRILKHRSCQKHVSELQEDLNSVIQWANQNNMALHEDKFELMVHRHCPQSLLYELPFTADEMSYKVSTGDVLYPKSQVKDLGISISSDLSWSIHINTMCARARSVAAWVLSAFKTRDRITLVTLYKSLVRSHLEYCCPLWSPRKITDIQLIEGVQRSFTSRIWGVQHLNY